MVLSLNDPIIREKVIAHPDYKIPLPLPPKPSNVNALENWRETCEEIKSQTSRHNAKLYKTIWGQVNTEEE